MVFPGLPVGVHCLGRTVGSRWWLLLPLEGAGAPRRAYTIHPPTPALLGKHPRTSTPKNGACTKTKQEHLESHICHTRIPLDNDHGKSTSQRQLSVLKNQEEMQRHVPRTTLMPVANASSWKTPASMSPTAKPCKVDTVEDDQACKQLASATQTNANFFHLSHTQVT